MSDKPSNPTLYSARLSDPRERAALPQEAIRGRAVRRAVKTSDVTRFRGVLAAAVVGASAAGFAIVATPPPGGLSSPGPLSRPHARAKLECASCHGDGEARAPRDPGERLKIDAICSKCHGTHGSTRPGHKRALASGQIGCATCHPIHRSDQGVVFIPGSSPIRFAPGVEATAPDVAFHPARPAVVPIATASSCAGCHDIGSPRDPIARCLIEGQEALGGARPVACFDEHEVSYIEDAPGSSFGRSTSGRDRSRPRADTGVCSGQHTEDRALAWEAAREIAVRMPTVSAPDVTSRPWTWIGAGLGASLFAFAFVRGGYALSERRKRKAAAPTPEAMLRPPTRIRLPQIDTNTCLGCYACVDACPYDVLEIERYVAVVARPEACCGLTLCEQRCPNGSLVITDGDPIGDRPRISDSLESLDVPGLYLAGDITGLPLIKNAIHQGSHAADQIADALARAPRSPAKDASALDLLVIGAGPAGISAALRAKERDLRCEVIEQGNVAQSIQSFPRGKLVFDQPLEVPIAGKLWLKESTKEELLTHWLRIVRQERLMIHQDTRMTSIAKEGDIFVVTTEPREGGPPTTRRAKRVLMAIGQRGSPRRLPFELPAEVEDRVHYHLADARSFAGKRVIVVGLGDVAMETAIALSRQPDTTVTVVHRRSGFTRGKTRNIDEVRRLASSGRIALHFDGEVTALDTERATIATPARPISIVYDAVMVMIGSIPPKSLLSAAGIRTVAEETSAEPADPLPAPDVFRDPIA